MGICRGVSAELFLCIPYLLDHENAIIAANQKYWDITAESADSGVKDSSVKSTLR